RSAQNSVAKFVFFNEFDNLRAGWRIAIFLVVVSILYSLLSLLLQNLGDFSQLEVVALYYGCVALGTFAILHFIDKRPFRAVGLSIHQRTLVEVVQGASLGFLLVSAVFAVQYLLGFVEITATNVSLNSGAQLIGASLLFFSVAAFGEEMMFRGYVFQTLIEGTSPRTAIIVMSIFFAGAHVTNPNVGSLSLASSILAALNVILAGVWFSLAYLKTKSLWFPAALHISWNFSEGFLYSFPVSGFTYGDRTLFSLTRTGPSWLTGGPFGPEGGILVTIALVASAVYIVKSPQIRIGDGTWNRQEFLLASLLPKNGSRKKL
ncbi:MAG TPA: type II CAAX endopeptidase family protein, partial [Bacteroidota bacterium]